MSKIKLKIAERRDTLLYMTRVENLFINEYLPGAPGDYVKVYLYALFCAQYEEETDNRKLAMILGLTETEVEEAWEYWAAQGLIRKSSDGLTIEFSRMLESFYGKSAPYPVAETAEAAKAESEPDTSGNENFDDEEVDTFYDFDSTDGAENMEGAGNATGTGASADSGLDARLIDRQLQQLFARYQEVVGRTVSRRETGKIEDALKVYGIKAEVLFYAIDYCADLKLDRYDVDYVFQVALRWKEEGCEDISAVKNLLAERSARNNAYREVFKTLGFNRLSNPGDRAIMDPWFDEMGFKLDEVLAACRASAGIREPNLRYVNKILENKMLERGGVKVPFSRGAETGSAKGASGNAENSGAKVSRKVLRDYYDHIREEDESAHKKRIREAVESLPGMKEVLDREKELNAAIASIMPGGSGRKSREELRNEKKRLEERKKTILEDEGYPADFLDRKYRCDICRDTGYTDEGRVCTCCRARADEAYIWYREKNSD